MKRVILIPIAFILIVGTACSLGQSVQKNLPTIVAPELVNTLAQLPTQAGLSGDAESLLETAQAAIDQATLPAIPTLLAEIPTLAMEPTAAEEPTEAVEPTAEEVPVETVEPTVAVEPTAETAAPTATQEPGKTSPTQAASGGPASGDYFVEKFTGDVSDLTRWLTVGDPKKHFGIYSDGFLRFEFPAMDTYAYATRNGYEYTDVYVEARGQVVSGTNASMAVICRVNADGWDEFRVNTKGMFAGTFEIYHYDKSLVAQHKVPYVRLINADHFSSMDIKTGNQPNTIGLLCSGQDLRIFINGSEQTKQGKIADKNPVSGGVGLGVIGYNQTASVFQYESLETKAPTQ